jgi:hypothetical protein
MRPEKQNSSHPLEQHLYDVHYQSLHVALSPEDLTDTDKKILEQLQEGRVTPQYLVSQLEISRTYASDKLRRLLEHGHVERLASGLYEIKDDPRE